MAAGLGSRFGGVKQLAQVGPDGEAIIDFSIRDAQAAGLETVVVIVRSDIEADVREHLGARHDLSRFRFVRQDELGPPRPSKPWGTLHAILSAAEAIDGPFAVINADDYYGPRSFEVAVEQLSHVGPGVAANVAFEIGQTVPPSGTVTRGVTEVADGHLVAIVETEGCGRGPDGTFVAGGATVPADTPVSMNLWCFDQAILPEFRERFDAFIARAAGDPKAECQLPTAVGELMAAGRLKVAVVQSPEAWIGITNPEDLELTRATLAARR